MRDLSEFRTAKAFSYPDQAVYAAYACAEFGLIFSDLDGGTGLVFSVGSREKTIHFGAGRCSWYPQNSATASTLASDKFFTNKILEAEGIATLGGDYFFLHARHRVHRPSGHERDDALGYFKALGGTAFVKPLTGSRGDFAQAVHGEPGLLRYLGEVSRYYDAILMQPIVSGKEYRVFLLDDEVLYTARKHPPSVVGDGVRTVRDFLIAHNARLLTRGLSPVSITGDPDPAFDAVLSKGQRWEVPGRMNFSAGGTMRLESPDPAAVTLARKAAGALGLRAAGVDLFCDIDGQPGAIKIIEVNANPSIKLLEQSGRADLILKIWHHTFSAMGLL